MKTWKILIVILFAVITGQVSAQETLKVKGRVLQPDKTPIEGAVISGKGITKTSLTDAEGKFEIITTAPDGIVHIEAENFYPSQRSLLKQNQLEITLMPVSQYKYNEDLVMPFRNEQIAGKTSSAVNLSKKELGSEFNLEKALTGKVAGLRVTTKGGMPAEGAYMNLRGIHSLVGANAPLIVINGIPYLPDTKESPIIGGFSKSILLPYNVNDIQNITVLKGAEASLYGSLGSNGVILIETDGAGSDKLDTRISFYGQYGMSWNNKTIPLMGVKDYKGYVNNVGLTRYDNMADLFTAFPFLKDDPGYYYNSLYNNNTDWQDEIYKPTFVTDNLFRVEGGDAIAKYDISLGYQRDGGIVEDTKMERYHTQLNTNVMVSRKVEMFATVGLAYVENKLQEQGMIPETNPVLAAYYKAPLLSPWQKDGNGKVLNQYDIARLDVSNPAAIVNMIDATNKMYDINIKFGLTYKPTQKLTVTGQIGLYYNYNRENIFIPGKDLAAILPLEDKLAENTVRTGVGEAFNMFYNLNGTYKTTFGEHHALNILAGYQALTSRREYDAGKGRNTTNDFYQTLDHVHSEGRQFWGYIDMWNWMNVYAHADYTYKNMLKASVNASVDATSASGPDATRFGVFPSAGLTWMVANTGAMGRTTWIDRLDIRAEYGLTGNSRFSSNYGKNYYKNAPLMDMSGIVRANIPNTKLKWENNKQLNLGVELAVFEHRFDVSFDYYNIKATDVIFANPISSLFGQPSYFVNEGEINNQGIEVAFQITPIRTANFEWIVGGNIATLKSEVKSLGKNQELIQKLSDGSEIITRVGENPYSFYGYKATGVYTTTAEANTANLTDFGGRKFAAGDARFEDVHSDNVLDEQDKTVLGSALPDFFGGFYTSLRWKNISLAAEFSYSYGNKAYNAVRRTLESGENFFNQSKAMKNRWILEGQITDIPRAVYGDPMDNNRFSSRWIEDASYLKLKNITLNYSFQKTFLRFFRSGSIYVTGENLVTFTKYLGLDPEFSYSYDDMKQGCDFAKVVSPRTIKVGVNLKF